MNATLNDLLVENGILPAVLKQVLVMRHARKGVSPKRFLSLAATRPDLFNAFQQTQNKSSETAMTKAAWLASFVGHESGKAVFVGIYRIGDTRPLSREDFWKIPAHHELAAFDVAIPVSSRASCLLFDLQLTDICQQLKGKLIVAWRAERAFCRRADRNIFPIDAILDETILLAA